MTQINLPPDLQKTCYVTEQEISVIIGRAVQSLRNDRYMGRGFPFHKIGKSVRYFLPEILAIMESYRVDPEARREAGESRQ
jgi:hypothetical protein